jgi:hypothetical protein
MSVHSRNSQASGVTDCMLSLAVLSTCCKASCCGSFLATADAGAEEDDDDKDDDDDDKDDDEDEDDDEDNGEVE